MEIVSISLAMAAMPFTACFCRTTIPSGRECWRGSNFDAHDAAPLHVPQAIAPAVAARCSCAPTWSCSHTIVTNRDLALATYR
jgi:hypothetical protein